MKTLPEISINQSLQKCESTSKFLSSPLQCLRPGFSMRVRMTWSVLVMIRVKIAHALKGPLAGLAAVLLALEAKINRRIFVGLGLMGVVAPLSACFYLLFNRVDYVEGWYHVNYFHLFFLLGPHLFIFFCLTGAFLLFPEGCKRAYLLALPTGYNLAKILWLIGASSNDDFWSLVPNAFLLIGILISAVLFFALDWLAHNRFHREDAFEARLENLVKLADDFDDAKFKSMVKTVWREKQAFKKQF